MAEYIIAAATLLTVITAWIDQRRRQNNAWAEAKHRQEEMHQENRDRMKDIESCIKFKVEPMWQDWLLHRGIFSKKDNP